MARVIACPSCERQLSLPESVLPGKQVRCPSCQAIAVVPPMSGGGSQAGGAVQKRPSSSDAASSSSTEERKERTKKKKKKLKKTDNNRLMLFVILGSLLFAGTLITLIIMYVPFGKMFAGEKEVEIVDVFTAVNAMGYNNVGVRVMNSDTTAYCIPGPRQIMISRPNPSGQYLLLKLKVPYADVAAFYAGAKGRNYLYKGHVQIEANGETKDALYIQDDNAETGYFQLDYQPPKQEGSKATLRDYIGPKVNDGWTHSGETKEYQEGIWFDGRNGMQVKVSVGSQRQDGGGGNVMEHFTGKKILGNMQGLTGGVAGYVFVDWNVGSSGFIVYSDLEEPNTIGTTWKVNCLVELPKGAGNEVTLKVLKKSRKLKIR